MSGFESLFLFSIIEQLLNSVVSHYRIHIVWDPLLSIMHDSGDHLLDSISRALKTES